MDSNVQNNQSNNASFDNASIKAEAKELLKGKWNKAALLSLVFIVITGGVSNIPHIGEFLGAIISGPMMLGLTFVFLKIVKNEDYEFEDLFSGFNHFIRSFLAYLLILIFVILWALLLIIPGIIAGLSYSLTFYILAENPDIKANEARKRSKELMNGYKADLFSLGFSFMGWFLLCIPTLGIGFFWLFPYMNTSLALFYKKVLALKSDSSITL